MTKRAAILIASPTVHYNGMHSLSYLHGSFNDLYEWKRFLKEPVGGCWNDDEIYDMSNSNSTALFQQINCLSDVDYLFFVYTGHGYGDATDDYIFMNYGQDRVNVNDIENTVKKLRENIKSTLIFDSCRCGLLKEKFVAKSRSSLLLENYPKELRNAIRSHWDKLLDSSSVSGVFKIQSCKKDEESYMLEYNTYSVFSYMMLAKGWHASSEMTVYEAFNEAKTATMAEVASWENGKKQDPICSSKHVNYPFSLSVTGANCIMADRLLRE